MGLLSIFKRKDERSGATGAGDTGDAVRDARTRARRRLIGAVVLLVIGVIGFPLVFETRPRPIPVDIPIEIPKKDGAPALVMPPARPAATAPVTLPATVAPKSPREEIITESPAEAGREVAPRSSVVPAGSAAEHAASRPTAKPALPAVGEAASRPVARTPTAPSAEGARAKALLDAKPASAAEGARFVVQVGAFAEAEAARETRVKVEKLGLKTYTQVAQTPAGSRIRVRVGPFGTRAEADAASARARAAGITAVVLTL